MKTITYTKLRNQLAEVLDDVTINSQEIIINRRDKKEAILISLEDYNSLKETAYLLGSPANATRLLDSIKEVNNDNSTTHELLSN